MDDLETTKTLAPVAADATGTAAAGQPPRPAAGLELLGRSEGSGYKDPPYLVRCEGGRMVQLPHLLYLMAERVDGVRAYEEIAREVSEASGRGVSAQDVELLVEKQLRPLGVVEGSGDASPPQEAADPLLALKLRTALIPERAVRVVTAIFRPLFFPPVILAVLAGVVAVDTWVFASHGVAQSLRSSLYQPSFLIMTFGLVVLVAALHEIGHATGCHYGGAKPGVMGAGIYIVWPAFYTDVTDSYRLGKGGKLRTDLGGVYFNLIAVLLTAGAYALTGFEPLIVLIWIIHLEIVRQLLPILRLDGYLVLSDLTGVPDLFARMKPILVSALPGRKADKRVTELKPWVRVVVTLWVLAVVPFLAFNIAMIVVHLPRIVATGWDSFWLHLGRTREAFASGQGTAGAAGVIQMIALALPAVGLAYSFSRAGVRLSSKAWGGTRERPVARWAALTALVAGVAALAWVWLPGGSFKPIQPGERWTIRDATRAVSHGVRGEPAFADVSSTTVAASVPGIGGGAPDGAVQATPEGGAPSPAVSPTGAVQPSPSASPSPEPTESVEPSPDASPSPTASPTPTPEVTASPEASPLPTPTPT